MVTTNVLVSGVMVNDKIADAPVSSVDASVDGSIPDRGGKEEVEVSISSEGGSSPKRGECDAPVSIAGAGYAKSEGIELSRSVWRVPRGEWSIPFLTFKFGMDTGGSKGFMGVGGGVCKNGMLANRRTDGTVETVIANARRYPSEHPANTR